MLEKDEHGYVSVLDHGKIKLVDIMGDDQAIIDAARTSYGDGTKRVQEDRGLMRYLIRNHHNTPIEMVVVRFHMTMPIFVARQVVRHRTASMNEYSARYSVMKDVFYVPSAERLAPQSTTNKQGSADQKYNEATTKKLQHFIEHANKQSYNWYQTLLKQDEFSEMFGEEPGLAKELARGVLNVFNYTTFYWQMNLHNLFHFLRLRLDPHAQWEVRVYAQAMYDLLVETGRIPNALEAFNDYIRGGASISRFEKTLLRQLIIGDVKYDQIESFGTSLGMSKREVDEFRAKFHFDK